MENTVVNIFAGDFDKSKSEQLIQFENDYKKLVNKIEKYYEEDNSRSIYEASINVCRPDEYMQIEKKICEDWVEFLNNQESKNQKLQERWKYKIKENGSQFFIEVSQDKEPIMDLYYDLFGLSMSEDKSNYKSADNYIMDAIKISGMFVWPCDKSGVKSDIGNIDLMDRIDIKLYKLKEYYKELEKRNFDNKENNLIIKWLSHFKTFKNYINYFSLNEFVNKLKKDGNESEEEVNELCDVLNLIRPNKKVLEKDDLKKLEDLTEAKRKKFYRELKEKIDKRYDMMEKIINPSKVIIVRGKKDIVAVFNEFAKIYEEQNISRPKITEKIIEYVSELPINEETKSKFVEARRTYFNESEIQNVPQTIKVIINVPYRQWNQAIKVFREVFGIKNVQMPFFIKVGGTAYINDFKKESYISQTTENEKKSSQKYLTLEEFTKLDTDKKLQEIYKLLLENKK